MRKAASSIEELTEAHLAAYIRHLREEGKGQKLPAPRSINPRLVVARSLYRFHTACELPGGAGTPLQPIPLFVERSRVGMYASRRLGRPLFRVKVPEWPCRPSEPRSGGAALREFQHLPRSCHRGADALLWPSIARGSLPEARGREHARGGDPRLGEGRQGSDPAHRSLRTAHALFIPRSRASSHEAQSPLRQPQSATTREPHDGGGTPRSFFRYHRKRSGIEKGNPHRLRHTFATDMVREGMSLVVLKRLMGHTNIGMTLRYVNFSAEDVRAEFDRALRRLAERSRDGKPLPGNP